MASPSRRLRTFRPATDALESYRPVSTLVPGFGDGVEPPVAQARAASAPAEPAVTVAQVPASRNGSTAVESPVMVNEPGATVVQVASAPSTVRALTSTLIDAGQSLAGIGGRIDFAAPSLITLSAATTAPVQTPAQSPQASAAVVAPSASSAPAPTPRDSVGDGIRPMTLAPAAAPIGGATAAFGGGKVTPMNSSGVSTPPAPTVSWSGGVGGPFQGQGSGTVSLPDTVPIGWFPTFTLQGASGWTIDPATIQWTGGTTYSRYFDDPATQTVGGNPGLQAVSLGGPAATNQTTYHFIVDANPRNYSISVNFAWYNPQGGADIPAAATTIQFRSIVPVSTSISNVPGYASFYTTATQAVVVYSDNPTPWIGGAGKGMVLNATTTTLKYGGDLMFMQLMSMSRSITDSSGIVTRLRNRGGGVNLDNGLAPHSLPIGMFLNTPPSPSAGDGWSQPANSGPLSNGTKLGVSPGERRA